MSQAVDQAVESVLSIAAKQNLNLEVIAVRKQSTKISYQGKQLDQFALSTTQQIGVRILDGKHEGVAYSESLDENSLAELVAEAKANAQFIEREFVSELCSSRQAAELKGLYNESIAQIEMTEKLEAAEKLESICLALDKRIKSVPYSGFADTVAQFWTANSQGLSSSYRESSLMAYSACLAEDAEGAVMDGESSATRDLKSLDIEKVARSAAEKTLLRLGATRPTTGKYTVVFENRAAEELLGLISGYFSAKAVDERNSPLADRLGTKVFSSQLSISDEPLLVTGFGARPFDAEGFQSKTTQLVADGQLASFLTNSVLAKKMKLPHTASASRAPSTDLAVSTSNLVVAAGSHSFSDLVNAESKVLVITSLAGTAGFRQTSGDFSLPCEGSMYVGGKRQGALKDFLISGNIIELLAAVDGVGNDFLAPVGDVLCPSLMVRNVNVSGQS